MKAEEDKRAEEEAAAAEAAKPKSRDKNSKNQSRPNLAGSQAPLSEGADEEKKEGEYQEAVPEEPVPPPFTSNSIHQFKRNLGNMGDIYVNDAPLASLTTSNTVNEIQCKQKVMGLKMTEALRSISQFFMKQFPLDINSIYVKKPNPHMQYYRCRSTAIIGGICKTSNDILEKILLANSFLDTFERIIFVGEIALAAIYALDLSCGKVERNDCNVDEYDDLKEFMIKLFNRAVEKDCEIVLPMDFVTAEKSSLEEIVASSPSRLGQSKPTVDDSQGAIPPQVPETSMSKASIPK